LAVEVQGELEDEQALREKAQWYRSHGVRVVWLVFPVDRRVLIVSEDGERWFASGEHLPLHPLLPDLHPPVDELFEQIEEH
jgi:Uma2 family endonuclease